MMTSRERLHRCYFGLATDRPAVYSRTGFPADDPTYDRLKALLAEKTELKRGWRAASEDVVEQSHTVVEPVSAEFERHVVTLETPGGPLRRSHVVSLTGQPGLDETYLIGDRADAERYLSLPMPRMIRDTTGFAKADREMGERGIVEVNFGFNPAGWAASLCGSEQFALLSIMDRDVVHALCERRTRILEETVKYVLAAGVGPYFSMLGEEYVVPPLHGPADFQEFNVAYDRRITALIHDGGGRIHIHSHGSMKRVLQGFVDLGADVLHPLEPAPPGDITPAEAKAVLRGKVCIEGNFQIADMYEKTPGAIRDMTAGLIRDAFDDGCGLIVCPTASPYIRGAGAACFPQYEAMVDTVVGYR